MTPTDTQRRDYYEILGVERSATDADIKRAYRSLARQHHPDVNRDDPGAEEQMKVISEAYAVLSDADRRAQYDRYGNGVPNGYDFGGGAPDMFDLFSAVFGGDAFGFGNRAHREAVGRSLRYNLEITLAEVLAGADREISYRRLAVCETCDGNGAAAGTSPRTCATCGGAGRVRATRNTFMGTFASVTECPHCRGRGQTLDAPCAECHGDGVVQRLETLTVHIPPGAATNDELLYRGFGEAPVGGGHTGDLHVRILVADDPRFVRHGDDLHMELSVSFPQAALGDTIQVEGLDGEVQVTIPGGIQTGEQVTVPERGLPHARMARRGSFVLHLRVLTPEHLTPRQRELLLDFARETGHEVAPHARGFFERIRDAIVGD